MMLCKVPETSIASRMSTVAPFNFSGSGSQFWGGASGVRIFPGKKKSSGVGVKNMALSFGASPIRTSVASFPVGGCFLFFYVTFEKKHDFCKMFNDVFFSK